MTDPTGFLSTIVATTAALVAIIGGLLVARFVGLDSDQAGAAKVLHEGEERLAAARARAMSARRVVLEWDAEDFFGDPKVVNAIVKVGERNFTKLRALADCKLTDDDARTFFEAVLSDLERARTVLTRDIVPVLENPIDAFLSAWDTFRRTLPSEIAPPQWPDIWREVFQEVTLERWTKAETEQKERERAQPQRDSMAALTRGPSLASMRSLATLGAAASTARTDYTATNARRRDDLVSERERALQRVDDLEAEVLRLRQDRGRIVRPDKRLWWGIGVLVYFTIVGIALPTWVMSRGPRDLTPHIRLLFWAFASGLAALVAYVVLYLFSLTTGNSGEGGPDNAGTSGQERGNAEPGGARNSESGS